MASTAALKTEWSAAASAFGLLVLLNLRIAGVSYEAYTELVCRIGLGRHKHSAVGLLPAQMTIVFASKIDRSIKEHFVNCHTRRHLYKLVTR